MAYSSSPYAHNPYCHCSHLKKPILGNWLANTALLSLARPNNPPSTSQRESTDGQANWLEVNLKHPAKQAPQGPPNDTQPRVLRNHWIIIRGLPEIRADRAAFETRNDIKKRSAVVKAVGQPGEQIVILKIQRLGPRWTNPPSSSRPLRVVVSGQAARDLLTKLRFQLHHFYLQVYFHFDHP